MKIDSANIAFSASRQAYTREETKESLRSWTGSQRPDFEKLGARANESVPRLTDNRTDNRGGSQVSLSAAALASLAADLRSNATPVRSFEPPPDVSGQSAGASAIQSASEAADSDPMVQLLRRMVEMMTGQAVRTFTPADLGSMPSSPAVSNHQGQPQSQAGDAPPAQAGYGLEYDFSHVREEFEQTNFAAEGTIKTSDGMEISFKLELSMTRYYREESSVSIREGDAVRRDPLVLNFNGTAAQLSDKRFSFDLNSDGLKENLALLASGSGYLAIDRNKNGRIDSGKELFGPATNSGFGELAALDDDKNGWIDENDAAYDALRVWTPTEDGAGKLETLRQRGVGALATGNVATPFELRGQNNSDLGAVAASGLFLKEDGKVGSLQEIDLTV